MTRKKLGTIVGILSFIGFLALRWMQRTPTEANEQDHPIIANAEMPAAVARVQRGRIGDTLTIAGAFKPFRFQGQAIFCAGGRQCFSTPPGNNSTGTVA
jgi:hypothetical protein